MSYFETGDNDMMENENGFFYSLHNELPLNELQLKIDMDYNATIQSVFNFLKIMFRCSYRQDYKQQM